MKETLFSTCAIMVFIFWGISCQYTDFKGISCQYTYFKNDDYISEIKIVEHDKILRNGCYVKSKQGSGHILFDTCPTLKVGDKVQIEFKVIPGDK